ncbi:MAG: signal peptide peptidase SppA [Pseudomonadota bacterium]
MADNSAPRPGLWRRFFNALTTLRVFTVNLIFVVLVLAVLATWFGSTETISVPPNAALVLNPSGSIVEARADQNPLQSLLLGAGQEQEVELQSLLQAIRHAATDTNIKMILLDLDELDWAASAHVQRLGEALQEFRETGKRVVAYGHYYTQPSYHLASFADALYMHPMGQLVLQGFGGFNFYFKDLLDKLGINIHVFRVGSYKSAVEPFLRNDMSTESRMASEALYQNLWQHLIADIAANRQIDSAQVQKYADDLAGAIAASQGDMARAALEYHFVDELLTSDQANVRIADEVGMADDGEINGIGYQDYLVAADVQNYGGEAPAGSAKIAVIVAQGMIVSSAQTGQRNVVAAEQTIELIRRARYNPDIKGVVLRVDSPGGSQFASELIRQELELVQLMGKPVVASFGATAASGGYWIAATADAIVSEPTTLTGSIGIYSIAPTFENSLEQVGVHTDGVGTTEMTLGMSPFTGVNPPMARVLQSQVEHGYKQFINLVARGRDMPVSEVEPIAEGRVWSGDVAHELGLVDELGGLQVALRRAAELAELETWSSVRLAPPQDTRSLILSQLLAPQSAVQGLGGSLFSDMARQARQVLAALSRLDDPLNIYTLCASCLTERY